MANEAAHEPAAQRAADAESDGQAWVSPLLEMLSGINADGVDEGIAAHYTAPFPEQRALDGGKAFTDLSNRDVIQLTGPDRLKLLHLLTTQDVEALPAGSSTELMVLSPTGHIESAVGALEDGESTWLLADVGAGPRISDFLMSMRFMMRVEAEARPDVAMVGVYGPARTAAAGAALRGSGGAPLIWDDPWPETAPFSATYGPADKDHPASGVSRSIVLVDKESLERVAAELIDGGLEAAGITAWEALRVGYWRPRPDFEVGERALPHELDWIRTAVHLEKGCYRGQETVAKLVNMGKPPRRLTLLYLEGPPDELPEHGDAVMFGERSVGQITSAVRHYEDGPVALALLRRNLDPSAVLNIGKFQATQEPIVNTDGRSSASPAERPGAEFRRRGPKEGTL
ncbi:MAG: CAF17-like 4Fe-4S cluster assembly/insertion protein YgfZ [Ancrocorticia sp.]|uniref:CAF17-like 4Fe-4S cluster assembly/insertion protein YgfZ n=1 Tax=Ancrocorticia sp. TaxID=2593684 RepID=UPI003F933243